MNNYKTIFVTLAVILVLLSIISCAERDADQTSDMTVTSTYAPIPEQTTPAVTTEAQISGILKSELSGYTIIYPDGSSVDMYKAVSELEEAISEQGVTDLKKRVDFVKKNEDPNKNELEILVGSTNRSASASFIKGLRTNDYGYLLDGKRIVISGATDQNTIKAVDAFIEFISKGGEKNSEYFITDGDSEVFLGEYNEKMLIGDKELTEYSIVYNEGDKDSEAIAGYFANRLEASGSYSLFVEENENCKGSKILLAIEDEMDENEYTLEADEKGDLILLGGSSVALYQAIDTLFESFNEKSPSILSCEIKEKISETAKEVTMNARIMSFNIRCAEFTSERIDLVIHMIKTYKPDSVGFQEATDEWVKTLENKLGDEYGYVSCGRNADRKGEASPIFYLRSKFRAVESDTKWMSNTPDLAGSKVAESSLPRIFTYVVLEEYGTGGRYVHVNTHLEHTSEEARVIQVKILLDYVKRFENEELTYVLTGDFNCQKGSGSYNEVISSGLVNSSEIAKKSEEGRTFHGYGKTSSVIDFIFIEKEKVTVDFYRACTETFTYEDGSVAYPSDHNPVIIDAQIKS